MKKILAAFAILVSAALVACGPSKLEIQEMSSSCDVSIEVGKVLDDTISLYVGNMFFLNAKQTVNEDLSAPNAVTFGIVVNEGAKNEIGFAETKTVNRLVEVLKTLEGGSVILFHEKDGQLTDAKKLF